MSNIIHIRLRYQLAIYCKLYADCAYYLLDDAVSIDTSYQLSYKLYCIFLFVITIFEGVFFLFKLRNKPA